MIFNNILRVKSVFIDIYSRFLLIVFIFVFKELIEVFNFNIIIYYIDFYKR